MLLGLLALAVGLRMQDPPAIERLRHLTFDTYNKWQPRPAGNDTVIIDIDEASIRQYGQWPWPRTLLADMTDKLHAAGARAIVFDIVFSEQDRTSPRALAETLPTAATFLRQLPDHDDVFAAAIARAGNVVMGFVGANQPTDMTPLAKTRIFNTGKQPEPQRFVQTLPYFTVSLPQLTEAANGNGSFTPLVESDGIVRRLPLLIGTRSATPGTAENILPALSLEAVRVALGKKFYTVTSHGIDNPEGRGIKSVAIGDLKVPTDNSGVAWVYYTGHRPRIYISASDILAGDAKALARLQGKIVFVGTSAIGLLDLRASPFKADLPGVEIHAEMAEQILHGQFLQRPSYLIGAELLATVVLSLAIIFLAPFVSTLALAVLAVGVAGGGFVLSFYGYETRGLLIDAIYPALVTGAIFAISAVLTNLRSENERRTVRQAFSHYVSPVLMQELERDPARLKLGGEVRDITVLFSDIRNFTTVSEGMDPAELIRVMNDFLTPMTTCVLENRGTVDKYIGDAMMAFWNAPLDDADHARHACLAALGMTAALAPVNAELEKRAAEAGRPFHSLRAGIGIHSGRAAVGNMGSRQRFAYSALGDTVNLASRLEGQTKVYGVSIIISATTQAAAHDLAVLELDRLVVKGRKGAETVFALLGDAEMAKTAHFKGLAEQHNALIAAYRAQRWDDAAALCADCAGKMAEMDRFYRVYAERITAFRQKPPAVGWDAVWTAADK